MISIIVPVYNVEKYFEECMESLIGQTYEDFEVIVINDGSTDRSAILCDQWAEKDSRVRVFHQENKGLSAVRNRGLELARGEYIVWVDGDDYVDKCYLEKLSEAYKRADADMVMCSFCTDTDGLVEHKGKTLFPAEEIDRQIFLEKFYVQGMYSVVWNKFLPKEAYGEIRFPVGRVFEDSSVMLQLTKKCNKIVILEEPLYYYRRHKESITLQTRDEAKSIKYLNDNYLWLKEDIEQHHKDNNAVLAALASRRLCNTIIEYSGEIHKESFAKWKKRYNVYKKDIFRCKEVPLHSKLKYVVGGISFSVCRRIQKMR